MISLAIVAVDEIGNRFSQLRRVVVVLQLNNVLERSVVTFVFALGYGMIRCTPDMINRVLPKIVFQRTGDKAGAIIG